MKIKIKKLHPDAKIPTYANPGDAGMDIYSIEDLVIKPNYRALIKTGLTIVFPEGYTMLVWDKSGLAMKGVTTIAGVIDAGFRGELKIALLNIGSKDYIIKKGEKIAQVLIQKVEHPLIEEVDSLTETQRGKGGFGSSGI
jgi:dUTP pyrophosphatase